MEKNSKILLSSNNNTKLIIGITLFIILFVVALFYLEVNLIELILGIPSFLTFFVTKFVPPNFENINETIPLMLQTLNFAVVATVFSSITSLLFSLLMSRRTNPITPLRYGFRFFITFFRTVPVIIFASILVYIFGIGPVSGIISLVIVSLGFLSRAFAESLDDIPEERLEALKAVGATKTQIFIECIIPNFTPMFLDWSLYVFQINILASVLLGLVGAGGIGIQVQNSIRLFQFNSAMAVIIVIIVMVVITELVTNKIRKMIK